MKWLLLVCLSACQSLPDYPRDLTVLDEENTASDSHTLLIAVLDVGQGDATLLIPEDGKAILIDAGPPDAGAEIRALMTQLGMETFALAILSHYDSDHIGGMDELVSGDDGIPFTSDDLWPEQGVFDRGLAAIPETIEYDEYAAVTDGRRNPLQAGQVLTLAEDLTVTCMVANAALNEDGTLFPLFPDADLDENDRSIGLLIEYGDFRYWTGGDLPGGDTPDLEGAIAPLIGPIDVLHTHHHGSKTSTSNAFLGAVTPRAALISAGADNSYGHPAPEVIDRLLDHDIDLYATLGEGPILVLVETSGDFSINGKFYGVHPKTRSVIASPKGAWRSSEFNGL